MSIGSVWRLIRRVRLLRLEPPPRIGTGLLAGRDGWLFWIGLAQTNLEHWRDTPKMRRRIAGWSALVRARRAALAAAGIEYRFAVMPDKLSVHHGRLVDPVIDPALAIGRRLLARLRAVGAGEALIDLFGPLDAKKAGEDLYLRTDTHFTPAGYVMAYRTICEALGAPVAPHVVDGPVVAAWQSTDLGAKLDPPAREWAGGHSFARRAERVRENELNRLRERQESHVAGISVGSVIALRNDDPGVDPRCLAVFGDSFTFAPTGLGAMLAESFRETHLVWSTRLDAAFIAAVRPDVVLTEVAEFFLGPVPVDGGFSVEALAAERFAAATGRGAERAAVSA